MKKSYLSHISKDLPLIMSLQNPRWTPQMHTILTEKNEGNGTVGKMGES
jgi:hypothetical protein